MQVSQINQGQVSEYQLNGTLLDVSGFQLDLAAQQQDQQVNIDIVRNRNGQLQLGGAGAYVANLMIPAARYNLVDTGQVDNNGDPIMQQQHQPLDLDAVSLQLWAV